MKLNKTRLTKAREYCRLSKKELAAKIGVSPSAVSRYESGDISPSLQVIENLERELNLQSGYLCAEDPPEVNVHFRKQYTTPKPEVRQLLVEASWSRQMLAQVEARLKLPNLTVPQHDIEPVEDRLDEVAKIAHTVRDLMFAKRDEPVLALIRKIEQAGVIVLTREWESSQMDGFSDFAQGHRPFMALNIRDRSAVRFRFSAAHELGHIVMHRSVTPEQLQDGATYRILEAQANKFAAELLLPKGSLPDDAHLWTLNEFLPAKLQWRVSVASMIHNLKATGKISESRFKALYIDLSRRGWRKVEPFDDRIEREQTALLPRALQILFERGITSPEEICRQLYISAEQAGFILGLPRLFNSPTQEFDLEVL